MLRTDRWVSDEEQTSKRSERRRLMEETLLDMKREAASVGAQLIVVLIPSKEEVYWNVARDEVPIAAEEIDRPVSLVADFGGPQGIAVCDLWPAFERAAESRRQLSLRGSGHWNDAGNPLAADTIAACLSQRGLLAGGAAGVGQPSRGEPLP